MQGCVGDDTLANRIASHRTVPCRAVRYTQAGSSYRSNFEDADHLLTHCNRHNMAWRCLRDKPSDTCHLLSGQARLVSIDGPHHQRPSPKETRSMKDADMERPLLETSGLGDGLRRHVGQKDMRSPRRAQASGASPLNRPAINPESGARDTRSAGMDHDGSTSPAFGSGKIVSDPHESYQGEAFENSSSAGASGSPARTTRLTGSGVPADANAGVLHGGNVHQDRDFPARPAIRAVQATPTSCPGAALLLASPTPSPRQGRPYPLAKSSGLGGERDRSSTLILSSSPRTERFVGSPRDSNCILSGIIDSERAGSTIANGDAHGMATLRSPSPSPRQHPDRSTSPMISPERDRSTLHKDVAEVVIDLTSRAKISGKEDSISRVDPGLKRDGEEATHKDGDAGGDKDKEGVCERKEETRMTQGQERALRSFLRGVSIAWCRACYARHLPCTADMSAGDTTCYRDEGVRIHLAAQTTSTGRATPHCS